MKKLIIALLILFISIPVFAALKPATIKKYDSYLKKGKITELQYNLLISQTVSWSRISKYTDKKIKRKKYIIKKRGIN